MRSLTTSPEARLGKLRRRVDAADRRLLRALADRFSAVHEIIVEKEAISLGSFQKARWEEVVATRSDWAMSLGLDQRFVSALLRLIHSESLRIQRQSRKKGKQVS
ncbi:MAG: chorismate mutase [Candidatus Riflebacteria bacterium]|nr:chorismate mutase [Candidatus Riflebacteria bacterium]